MGRRPINRKKINKENYLKAATFSKRRNGLFRKAGDLCSSLSGAEVGIIVFSPGNRPFVFGHPSADSVFDRFLAEHSSPALDDVYEEDDHDDLEVKKEDKGEVLQDDLYVEKLKSLLDEPKNIEDLGVGELKKYKALLEGFRERVNGKIDDMKRRQACTTNFLGVDLDGNSEIGSGISSSTTSEERESDN